MVKKTLLIVISILILIVIPSFCEEIELTEEEQEFIKEHPVIHLGVDPYFVPFEFIDSDGNYKGIASDYIKLIEERTGLDFQIEYGLTWSEAFEKAVEKDLDVLPCVSKTEEREKYFLFSEGYYQFERVIVMHESEDISDYKDIFGKTVAVQQNSSHHSFLMNYPQINTNLYQTAEEALQALASEQEKFFIGNLATTSYLINELGIQQLKYVIFPSEEKYELHFAVRDDWPELRSIINKALESITNEERITINNRWIGVNEAKDYTKLIRNLIIIFSIILIIVGVSFFWIVKLRAEIKLRIQYENELKVAKQDAEIANHIKSNFLARMSHEIRTPLNAITGLSYLVLQTELKKSQRAHLEKIRHASDTMLSIINDILDFSKIEAGKIDIENESFELDEVIRNVMNIISFKIEDKDLNFTMTKDPALPNYYYGDSVRIGQVLLNLLNNAIKFTESGGISFLVELYGFERDVYQLEFVIKDSGIGMSESHLDKLFEPFTQEDASITRRFGGTGLGLSIVKNLVELMGGSVSVKSELGEGTEFTIRLKLKADQERERKVRRGFEYIRDIKTLILNKDMNSLSLISEYLKSFSIDSEFTSSEEQFLNIIESNEKKYSKSYDLIILFEGSMNNSEQLMKSVREIIDPDHLPKVIYIYGLNKEDNLDKLVEGEYVLHEPFLPSTLYNAITELFKFKVMASQVERTPQVKTKETVISGKLMIVEDNKTNQMIAYELLTPLGLDVTMADHGKMAIELFDDSFELVLMDLHMPVMNGYEATKHLRDITNVPIIAMTADAIDGVKDKCRSIGMNDFITKPFDPEQFIKKVSEYMKGEKKVEDGIMLLDKSLGIKLMGGNDALYEKVEVLFLEENKNTLVLLDGYIKEEKYLEGAELIHKVKSSAGSLGSDIVNHTATSLQAAFESKDVEEINELYVIFKNQFASLMRQVKKDIEH